MVSEEGRKEIHLNTCRVEVMKIILLNYIIRYKMHFKDIISNDMFFCLICNCCC